MEIDRSQLHSYFESIDAPYWKLYSGSTNRGTPNMTNLVLENFDDSWKKLDETLSWCTVGIVTISFHTSSSAKPSTVITVKLNGQQTDIKGTRSGGSFSQLKEMLTVMQMMQNLNGGNKTVDEEALRKQIKMEIEHKDMLDLIKNGGVQPDSPKDIAMMELAKQVPAAISGLGHLLGIPMIPSAQAPAQLGTLGQDDTTEENPNNTTATPPPNAQPKQGLSVDLFLRNAQRILIAIPGTDINVLWHSIANMCEKDPNTAAGYINTIIAQNGK